MMEFFLLLVLVVMIVIFALGLHGAMITNDDTRTVKRQWRRRQNEE